MSNDDTRDIETPDRSIESHQTTICTDGGTHSVRDRLTTIDEATRALLVTLHEPAGTAIEGVDAETRAEAAHHVREIRAEASQVGLTLLGPTATMHYSPFAEGAGDGPIAIGEGEFATTHDGPEPETHERVRDRSEAQSQAQDDDHDTAEDWADIATDSEDLLADDLPDDRDTTDEQGGDGDE